MTHGLHAANDSQPLAGKDAMKSMNETTRSDEEQCYVIVGQNGSGMLMRSAESYGTDFASRCWHRTNTSGCRRPSSMVTSSLDICGKRIA